MGDVEWTNELAVRLMAEYRRRPELWDSAHDLYRVHTAKYEAWAELAGLFRCDIGELRKKLNSIFASHRREKGKVRAGGRSTWFLYPHMSFLPTHVPGDPATAASERRRRASEPPHEKDALEQLDAPARTPPEEDGAESVEEDEVGEEALARDGVVVKTEPGAEYPKARARRDVKYGGGRKSRLAKLLKRRAPGESFGDEDRDRLLETMRLLRRSDLLKKKDECDSFGEYIADSLRKHDERTQSMIKQAINNILFEQEMKRCAGAHCVPPARNPLR